VFAGVNCRCRVGRAVDDADTTRRRIAEAGIENVNFISRFVHRRIGERLPADFDVGDDLIGRAVNDRHKTVRSCILRPGEVRRRVDEIKAIGLGVDSRKNEATEIVRQTANRLHIVGRVQISQIGVRQHPTEIIKIVCGIDDSLADVGGEGYVSVSVVRQINDLQHRQLIGDKSAVGV
jgi:hypothetical protein